MRKLPRRVLLHWVVPGSIPKNITTRIAENPLPQRRHWRLDHKNFCKFIKVLVDREALEDASDDDSEGDKPPTGGGIFASDEHLTLNQKREGILPPMRGARQRERNGIDLIRQSATADVVKLPSISPIRQNKQKASSSRLPHASTAYKLHTAMIRRTGQLT